MDCERVESLISAQVDGEIGEEEQRLLAAHLEGCERCRNVAAACRAQDRELREAFAGRKRSATELASRLASAFASAPPRRRPFVRWALPVAAALVAGILLGRTVIPPLPFPGRPPGDSAATDDDLDVRAYPARLAFATGAVETLRDGGREWKELSVGRALHPGARVRCASDALCELQGADGSVVRLDRGTEVALAAPRTWELDSGRIQTIVTRGDVPFEVRAAGAKITALGTRFGVQRSGESVSLEVLEGAATVASRSGLRVVRRGERASVTGDIRVERAPEHDLLITSSWVHPLLVLEGRGGEELERRFDAFFAVLGESKMDFLLEKEIRALGPSCVVPLLRYLESPLSAGEPGKRSTAARIACDLATPSSIEDLVVLLADRDPSVRREMARALERLAGTDRGLPWERWGTLEWEACEAVYLRWVEWARTRGE